MQATEAVRKCSMHTTASIIVLAIAAFTFATAPEVTTALRHLAAPSETVVALWTMGPGLMAGCSLQLLGPEQSRRKVMGEILASLVMSFAGGAALMVFAESYASVWSLALVGIGAGATGSAGLRKYQHRTEVFIEKGKPQHD